MSQPVLTSLVRWGLVGFGALAVVFPLLQQPATEDSSSGGSSSGSEDEAAGGTSNSIQASSQRRRRRRSCLYVGQVWHRRFVPAVHAFCYSIFFTYLDLSEVEDGLLDRMWPLAASRGRMALASFDEKDHLKGYMEDQGLTLLERVRRLVEERTGTRPTGPICLLTHLRVLGYCFNPVSFYYCWDSTGKRVEAVVAEVSNTPWNEMYPYVLHPRSTDKVQVAQRADDGSVTNYRFAKSFHVSPFMDMEHLYDWDFMAPRRRIWVSTSMIKGTTRYFNAKFSMKREELTPAGLGWCLIRYPAITWTVQVLIHVQAFALWFKKVPFYPHPQGTETWASRAVGYAMAPLWKLQDIMKRGAAESGGDGGQEAAAAVNKSVGAPPEVTPETAAAAAAAAVAVGGVGTSEGTGLQQQPHDSALLAQ